NHTTGRRWLHNVGQHISLFVAGVKDKVALKLIAAKGKVQVQAQSDAMELTADKDVTITSCKNTITVVAKEEILLTCGGGYIRIAGGNIEVHCPGQVSVKGASHNLSGPTSLSQSIADLPREKGQYDQKFKIQWQGLDIPASNLPYRLKTPDGKMLLEGITNDVGETSLSRSQVPEGVIIEILKTKP
ncbi:DUF2345 domain-containing protein, partial [Chromobacterium vaccinii]|uniref:DUF2345 domain-containing protein n=1 Tax=Chromobacterium vaccinii TaxID=1108595 RepID=UPI001E492EC9